MVGNKRRLQRRPGLPIENPAVFYPMYVARTANILAQMATTYVRLRGLLWRALRDPNRFQFADEALAAAQPAASDAVVANSRGSTEAAARRRQIKRIGAGADAPPPTSAP